MGGSVFLISGQQLNDEKNYNIKFDEGLRWLNGGTKQPTESWLQWCACFWPPVTDGVLKCMRYQSLVSSS
jgi:hypothetical protein